MARKRPAITPRRPPQPDPVMNIDDFVNGGLETSTGASKRLGTSVVTRKEGTKRRRMTIYFDVDVAEELVRHCKEEGREISKFVNKLVSKGLES